MDRFVSKLQSFFYQPPPSRILMLGLDAAGKTTILYRLKLKEALYTTPTIGFNVETINPVKGVRFTVWDISGQKIIRSRWQHYLQDVAGVVYVVDSNDVERINEARDELHTLLNRDELRGSPLVVIANKQDLPHALNTKELSKRMELRSLTDRKWDIIGACATTGEGLIESMKTMSSLVTRKKP